MLILRLEEKGSSQFKANGLVWLMYKSINISIRLKLGPNIVTDKKKRSKYCKK